MCVLKWSLNFDVFYEVQLFAIITFVYKFNVISAKSVVCVYYMFGEARFVFLCVCSCVCLAVVPVCLPHCPRYIHPQIIYLGQYLQYWLCRYCCMYFKNNIEFKSVLLLATVVIDHHLYLTLNLSWKLFVST